MRGRTTALLVLLGCQAACRTAAADDAGNIGYGPFLVSSQSPGQSLRLGLIPREPSSLRPGDCEAYLRDTWTNTWVDKQRYQLDFERMNAQAALGYALNHRCEIEAAVVSQTTFGGWLDGTAVTFHRTLGLGQDGREGTPHGRTRIHIDPTGSQPGVDLTDADLEGITEVFGRFSTWYTVLDGGESVPTVAATMALQAPLHHYARYSGGYVDVAAGLAAAKRFGDVFTYAVANYTRYGPDRIYGIRLYQGGFAGLAAVEYRWLRSVRPIAQYLISQGIAPDYYDFSKASHEVTVGLKAHVDGRTVVELALLENVFVFDNSADFGVHVGCSTRW